MSAFFQSKENTMIKAADRSFQYVCAFWYFLPDENKCSLLYNVFGDKMEYITRDMLQGKLEQIQQYPLTCFYAPRGSGKRQQMKAYLEGNRLRRKWIDLAHYPIRNERRIKELKKLYGRLDAKVILILDHFTEEYTDIILELTADQLLSVVLVSDEVQEELHKTWRYIDLHDICLSKQELSVVCERNDISITQQDLQVIYSETFGWMPAVEVYLNYYRHYHEIMETQYLHALLEDIYHLVSNRLSQLLPVMSLCNTFSMELCAYMGATEHTLKELEHLAGHGWMIRKTADLQQYELSGALRSYLKSELYYQKADVMQLHITFANWFEQHHQIIDALYHYDQAGEYEAVIRILEDSRSVTFVDVSSKLLSRIYRNIPGELLIKAPYAWLRIINDTLTSLDVRSGMRMLEEFEAQLFAYPATDRKLQGELQLIYGYLYSNDIYKMNACFRKAYAYFQGEVSRISNVGMNVTLGSPHTMYIYHRTAHDLQHLVTYIKEELQYYLEITGNLNAGFREQSGAERYLETGNFHQAIQTAWEAYYIARTYQQESIMICSLFTILRAAILLHDDEMAALMKERLLQKLERNDNIYQLSAIHCALGYTCAVSGETKDAALHMLQIENRNVIDANYYSYVVKGCLLLYQHDYEKLKAVAAVMLHYYQHEPHVFGEIYAYIFEAVCYYKQSKTDIAKQKFHKAVALSHPDGITAPFLELYGEIEPLLLLLQDHEHIKTILHMHQKADNGLSSCKEILTQKELEIARLLGKGYTRKDIAAMLHVSGETVNTHAKRIFKKLKIQSWRELLNLSINDTI